jgi:hypothetical protein
MKKETVEKFIEELKEDCGDYLSFEDMNRKEIELRLLFALQAYYDNYY